MEIGNHLWINLILQLNYKGYGTDTLEEKTVAALKTEVKTKVVKNPKSIGKIETFQDWLNQTYKTGIKSDNLYGPKTKKEALMALPTDLNKQFGAGLKVDGIWDLRQKQLFAQCLEEQREISQETFKDCFIA